MGGSTPPPPRVLADLARTVTVATLGDSISNGSTTPFRNLPTEWTTWALLLSSGRIMGAGHYGRSGATTADIINEGHLANVVALSPKPTYCLVLIATNDLSVFTLAQTIANLTTIYTTLRGAGITPVVHALTPRNGLSTTPLANMWALQAWLPRYAMAHGYPYVDLHTPTTDPTSLSWTSGLNVDGTHPNATGAKIMGQTVVSALVPYLPPWTAPLVHGKSDPSCFPANACFIDDTDSDGTPDYWNRVSGAGDCSFSLTSGASDSVLGNWMIVNKTANTGGSLVRSNAMSVAAGDRVAFGFKLKTSSFSGAKLWVHCVPRVAANISAAACPTIFEALYDFTENGGVWTFFSEYTMPATALGCTTDLYLYNGTGQVQLGQATMRNLTALGVS